MPVTALPFTLPIWLLVTQLAHATLKPSAVVALPALRLRTAYGFDVTGWRELSVVNVGPLVGLTAISRNRAAPLKQLAHEL